MLNWAHPALGRLCMYFKDRIRDENEKLIMSSGRMQSAMGRQMPSDPAMPGMKESSAEKRRAIADFDRRAFALLTLERGNASAPDMTALSDVDAERYTKWKKGFELQEDGETLFKAKHGDKKAMEKVFDDNMGLVRVVAYHRIGATKNLELEDLIQEGSLGLFRAVELFDFEKGVRFSTYAMYWIRRNIERVIKNFPGPTMTGYAAKEMKSLMREKERLQYESGTTPSPEELSHRTGLNVTKVSRLLLLKNEVLSLDYIAPGHNGSYLSDIIAANDVDVEGQVIEEGEKRRLSLMISRILSPEAATKDVSKEEPVLRLRVLIPYAEADTPEKGSINKIIGNAQDLKRDSLTLEEIGFYFHISKQRVQQILSEAVEKLRKSLESPEMVRSELH